jgi:Fe-S cluster assembly iron-binding protein IscA
MIKIDKKTLVEFQENGVNKIHVFFYEAGCSGTKVDIESDFEVSDELFQCTSFDEYGIDAYVKIQDREKFDWAMITKIREKSDNPHLQGVKNKYIFSNPKIEDRCGCGTSFAFEKKVPKIDLEKLRFLKDRFGK